MNNRTAKLINEPRVKELLDCYGANSARWPEEERASAVALINHSPELQQYQQQAQRLDEVMQIPDGNQALRSRPESRMVTDIMRSLPEQSRNNIAPPMDQVGKNTTVIAPKWWKYSAVAAAAMLVLAVTVVIEQSRQAVPPSGSVLTADAAGTDLDQWFWEQATGFTVSEDSVSGDSVADELNPALSPDDNDEPATFMAMVELELPTQNN